MIVLVVDDSIMFRKTMQRMLEKLGHSVILATNGRECIEVYKKEKPDLVTMDLSMLGMTGIEALKHLIIIDPDVKVIMSTANSFSDSVLLSIKEGALGYLIKPVTIDILEDAINKIPKSVMRKETKEEDDFFKDM